MTKRIITLVAAVCGLLAAGVAQADEDITVVLVSDGEVDSTGGGHGGIPGYNVFSGPDDNAIYFSAGDWMRDPNDPNAGGLDGLADTDAGLVFNFGMTFANDGYDYPEGFDRQVKQLHEYKLAPAYEAPVCAETLLSATLTIGMDRVIDISLSGATDLVAPEFLYIRSFVGDGLLSDFDQVQLDFERVERTDPNTWDATLHILSERGERLTQDEIDYYGGAITFDVDVTELVREIMVLEEDFAGLAMAASHDGEFAWVSVDPPGVLPYLTLVGQGYLTGDLDRDGDVDLSDLAQLLANYRRTDAQPEDGDLDGDGDVDLADLAEMLAHYRETGGAGVCDQPPPPYPGPDGSADDDGSDLTRAGAERIPARRTRAPEELELLRDPDGDGASGAADPRLLRLITRQ